MGWKTFKDHYRIGHTVAFFEGEGFCIGSGYIHGIIVINPDSKSITTCRSCSPPDFSNDDLSRYWREIHTNLDLMWSLLAADDEFEKALPVYTYKGGSVVECACEEYGYPNVTHDGQLMYDNMFFELESDARAAGIRNAQAGVENLESAVDRTERDLAELFKQLSQYRFDLAKLSST